jgi:hypothetical protein
MVRTMCLCRWYSVQYMKVRQNSTYSSTVRAVMSQCPSFFEVGSIQALKDANEIQMYEWSIQDTRNLFRLPIFSEGTQFSETRQRFLLSYDRS